MLSRFKSFVLVCIGLLLLASIFVLHPPMRVYFDPQTHDLFNEDGTSDITAAKKVANGGVIMGKLQNETAKAALGRATWKLLHTMTLRYPENPTADEREALRSYLFLTSRLYPCGECATEFQALLKDHPPQTSDRRAAAMWLCFVHNLVNKRLGKPEYPCDKLEGDYDCGCGDVKATSGPPVDSLTGEEIIRGG